MQYEPAARAEDHGTAECAYYFGYGTAECAYYFGYGTAECAYYFRQQVLCGRLAIVAGAVEE